MSQGMNTSLKLVNSIKSCGGYVQKYSHVSRCLGGLSANFSVFLPEQANAEKVPVLYWLSGLTCTEDNFMQKAGAQKYANKHGIALVCPDTSPRTTAELEIKSEHDSYDFGSGAGFYVNATQKPWSTYYQTYDYVNSELPKLLQESSLPLQTQNASIFGHSMGGHGSLISFLKNPGLYQSVSAFSPICNPINCRWGQKCFGGYLGDKQTSLEQWKQYDATELIQKYNGDKLQILIDQGTDDQFLADGDDAHNQLLPENFLNASRNVQNVDVNLRMQKGYDHSYYFITSFVQDHLDFHAQFLKK